VVFLCSGKFVAPCTASSHVMMVTPITMQAAYANFPQQAGVTFQPQSPICASNSAKMMEDLMVRIYGNYIF